MQDLKISAIAATLIFALLFASVAGLARAETAPPPAGQALLLERSVLSCGGSEAWGTTGKANGTLGQASPTGEGSDGGMILRAGFWAWPRGTSSSSQDRPTRDFGDHLFQSFPNPFEATTTIEYTLSRECSVTLTVFDIQGRRIRTLVSATRPAGLYRSVWDGRDEMGEGVSPGIYLYRLEAGNHNTVRKMVLAR